MIISWAASREGPNSIKLDIKHASITTAHSVLSYAISEVERYYSPITVASEIRCDHKMCQMLYSAAGFENRTVKDVWERQTKWKYEIWIVMVELVCQLQVLLRWNGIVSLPLSSPYGNHQEADRQGEENHSLPPVLWTPPCRNNVDWTRCDLPFNPFNNLAKLEK